MKGTKESMNKCTFMNINRKAKINMNESENKKVQFKNKYIHK